MELVPVTGMSDAELKRFAEETYTRVRDETVRTRLSSLMLHGVVRRHSESPDASYEGYKSVRAQMAAGTMAAYGVCASSFADCHDGGEFVGTASMQPGLELRRQALPLPPPYARRLGSIPIIGGAFSSEYPTTGPNAVAWVDPRVTGESELTAAAQYQLRQQPEATGMLWRLVPEAAVYSQEHAMHVVMEEAGFRPHAAGGSYYYDDQEVGRRQLPPLSVLYEAPALQAA